MPLLFNRLVIVGVGLIGGSLGLAARAQGLVSEVIGFGRTEANLKIALERGILDSYTFDPAEAARGADLLLLAVPVEATQAGIRGQHQAELGGAQAAGLTLQRCPDGAPGQPRDVAAGLPAGVVE